MHVFKGRLKPVQNAWDEGQNVNSFAVVASGWLTESILGPSVSCRHPCTGAKFHLGLLSVARLPASPQLFRGVCPRPANPKPLQELILDPRPWFLDV